jgi:hypothetical protein
MRIKEKERSASISTATSTSLSGIVAAGNGAKYRQVTDAAATEFRFLRRESLSHSV